MPQYTVEELTTRLGGDLLGNPKTIITGLSSAATARPGDIFCATHKGQLNAVANTLGAAVICQRAFECQHVAQIIVARPIDAWQSLLPLFSQPEESNQGVIDDTAVIGQYVELADNVDIGANAVIADNVVIKEGVRIGCGVIIGANAFIDRNTKINHRATIESGAQVGSGVSIDSGVVIGARPYNPSKVGGQWQESKAFGTVIIGDDVSIGANTTIDRGVYGDTIIGRGVKIDNLVQIAHDVIVGAHSTVVACAAIGANTAIGEHCIIGGGSCLASNIKLVDNVAVTGMGTVSRSIKKEGLYSSGTTVQKHELWRKNVARFHRLDAVVRKLHQIEMWLTNDRENV